MHWLPDGAGFDVCGFEGQAQILARCAKGRGVHGQAGEPTGVASPSRFCAQRAPEGDAGQMAERFLIIIKVAPPGLDAVFKHADLTAPNASQHIAEAIVVADHEVGAKRHLRMLIVGRVVAGLGGELAGVGNECSIVGDEHTTTTHRHWCGLPVINEVVMILLPLKE